MIDTYALGTAIALAMNTIDDQDDPAATILFRAAPHQWGEGKIHICGDGLTTRCGQDLTQVAGQIEAGHRDAVTCLICIRSFSAEIQRQEREVRWQEEQRHHKQRRQQSDREWQEWYEQYLDTPEWCTRRAAVLERANGLCEGCRKRPATQVHHLTYDRVGQEMLFDLVAVCRFCHQEIHSHRRTS